MCLLMLATSTLIVNCCSRGPLQLNLRGNPSVCTLKLLNAISKVQAPWASIIKVSFWNKFLESQNIVFVYTFWKISIKRIISLRKKYSVKQHMFKKFKGVCSFTLICIQLQNAFGWFLILPPPSRTFKRTNFVIQSHKIVHK
jgi:hypothetical protein